MLIRSAQRFRIRRKGICGVCVSVSAGNPDHRAGEVFTDAIVEKIMAYKAAGLLVQGPADPDADVILTLSSEDGNNGCTGPLILIQ